MKKMLLSIIVSIFVLSTQAQISVQSETMQLPSDMTEWSLPITVSLQSEKMVENSVAAVPVQFKVHFKKRMMRVCHYEMEITNTSATQSIEFRANNLYTDASSNIMYYNVKLKPGKSALVKMMYASNSVDGSGCWPKEDEECRNCGWTLYIDEIKSK